MEEVFSQTSSAVSGLNRMPEMPKGRRSSRCVQWYSGLRSRRGTVAAQASYFSRSGASPEQRRSGMPFVLMARHL